MSGAYQRPDALTATPARRMALRVTGPALPYLLHLRPREWPIVTAHATLGWLLAGGFRAPDGRAVLGLAAWVVALNGGTLALNSAFDRDQGDIAYLRQPPPVPKGLAGVAGALMLAGGVLTWSLPFGYRAVYLLCVMMSVLYSVPPIRLKAIGGADWVINMIGFGVATPFAGWAITGRPFGGPLALVVWAFLPLFGALYPLTQLYQMDEDLARGDRTLVLRLGTRRSLALALAATGLAFGLLFGAAWRSGWRGGSDWPRWAALAAAMLAWMVVLGPWYRDGRRWSSAEHERGMYHALAAWLLTDVAVLLGWVI
ncbi:MAG: UbiA family prenyltransferase [Gemmatimonadota bacterium]